MSANAKIALSLLEDVQVAVLVHDVSARVTHANAPARAMFGLGAEATADVQPEGRLLVRDDGTPLLAAEYPMRRVLATRTRIAGLTLGVRRDDGEITWALVQAGPHLGEDGEIDRVVMTAVDITSRRAAELALLASETRYRTLFDSLDAAVLLMRGPACIACNTAALKLFGLACVEEIIGKTPLDFAPPVQPDGTLSVDIVQQNIMLALQHGTHRFEWQSVRANGERFMMEVRFTPFRVDGEDLFQCIALDISDRKRAEAALRESEARFRRLVELAPMAVLAAGVETRRIRYANPEVCRMLGYTEQELLSLRIDDLHPPEAVEKVLREVAQVSSGAIREVALPLRRKDGTVFEAGAVGLPIQLAGELCSVGFFRDDTVARQLEQERLRAQKLEAVGLLAGGIAHDFNNLLQGLFGSIAAAKLVAADAARCRAMLTEAEQALNMAVGLTRQLLAFSRGGKPVKKPLALPWIIEPSARLALSGSRVASRVELPDDLWAVEGDEGQLAQVVQNIVLNAAQSMPAGGTVEIRARNVRSPGPTLPTGLPDGAFVAISVHDTGVGIAADNLARIFDPYFTTREQGSGLGLATSYAIVVNHGGLIDVDSAPGRGSTFTVYLPARTASASPVVAEQDDKPVRRSRVLVMDDDDVVRATLVTLLDVLGHEVRAAADGAAAVALFSQARAAGRPFEVVILDLTVRDGMGGSEAIAQLRGLDPSVRAIVSSGYSEDDVLAEYRAHGFRAVLPKPYTVGQLKRAIDEALEGDA